MTHATRGGAGLAGRATVRVAAAIALAVSVAGSASAQSFAVPKCAAPDTTKPWFAQQRAWLDESKHDWSNDTLRQNLLRVANLSASKPVAVQIGWSLPEGTGIARDSAGVALLRGLLKAPRGSVFPTRSVVGAAGVRAIWILALGDSLLEAGVMRRFMEAGLGEGFEADIAVLEDRVRAHAGRGQLYGSALQAAAPGARPVPYHIEDSTHVDMRRDAAGLPPLAQGICAAMRRQM